MKDIPPNWVLTDMERNKAQSDLDLINSRLKNHTISGDAYMSKLNKIVRYCH